MKSSKSITKLWKQNLGVLAKENKILKTVENYMVQVQSPINQKVIEVPDLRNLDGYFGKSDYNYTKR